MAEHREILRRGPRSLVVRGPAPGTVTKTFTDVPGDPARNRARTEFDRLDLLWEALTDTPGATCPRPLSLDAKAGAWHLVMSEVEGEALNILSLRRNGPPSGEVGKNLATALVAYGRALGEPQYGLRANDVFVSPAGEVALLDLEPENEDRLRTVAGRASPAAASMGFLLGRLLHGKAAPHAALRRGQFRWAIDVVFEAVRTLDPSDRRDAKRAAGSEYRDLLASDSRWWRPLWYGLRWLDVVLPAMLRLSVSSPRRD